MSEHGQTPGNPAEPHRDVDVDLGPERFLLGDPAEPGDDDYDDEFGDDRDERPGPGASRARKIVLVVFLVLAILAVGGLCWFLWLVHSGKQISLSTPDKVGSLSLDQSEDAKSSAEYLRDALDAQIDLDKSIGAVYSAGDKKDVLFFGGTTFILKPAGDLKSAFGLITDSQGAVTGLHNVDAGALGGTMQCGTTKSDDGDLTVCGWADHGSVAIAMFPNRTEADAAPLFRQLREAIEHHN